MPADPGLRAARAADADVVVPLLVEAMDTLALELAGVASADAAQATFRALYLTPGLRYAAEHVQVLEHAGQVVAALLAYPGADEARLAAATLAWLARRDGARALRHQPESRADEYYLDALAVVPAWRGRGFAAALIDAACAGAHAAGHARAGLLVDVAKPGVKRLYQRLGFRVDGRCTLAGHAYEHMTRVL